VTLTTGAAKVSGGVRSIRAVPSPRSRIVDACPGALRLHAAADGPLARVRLPGGLVTGAQLRTLREVAETWGDGHLELTSRANVQLRALTEAPPGALADRLAGAGLLPSDTHELVRNIIAAITPAVRPLIRELDRALCADPRLAELPGRFLFAIGGSAVADITACGTATDSPEDTWPAGPAAGPGRIVIRLAGEDVGLRVSHDPPRRLRFGGCGSSPTGRRGWAPGWRPLSRSAWSSRNPVPSPKRPSMSGSSPSRTVWWPPVRWCRWGGWGAYR
jgi:precorrin-3B synthase